MKTTIGIIIAALGICMSCPANSQVVSKATKTVIKTVAKEKAEHEAAELAIKQIAKSGVRKGTEKAVGESLSKRVVSRVLRKKLSTEIAKAGTRNMYTYANKKVAKKILTVGESSLIKSSKASKHVHYVSSIKKQARQKAVRKAIIYSAEENAKLVNKLAAKVGLSANKAKSLIAEMNNNNELAALIHSNPEFNMRRWKNAHNHVNKDAIARSPKGKLPVNAKIYAGNTYYFNPLLNPGLKARLEKYGYIKIRGKEILTLEDLIKLDKMYPEGVPFSKEGFPDFSRVAAKSKDGKPISVDIGSLTGNRIKDQQLAQKIFVERGGDEMEGGYTWHHIENSTCLLRVPYTIHALVDHSGGISMAAVK